MTRLEFTYRIRGRIVSWVEGVFAICAAVVLTLEHKPSDIWQDLGAFGPLVLFVMIGLPMQWLFDLALGFRIP
jgi:hypothetical protein